MIKENKLYILFGTNHKIKCSQITLKKSMKMGKSNYGIVYSMVRAGVIKCYMVWLDLRLILLEHAN